MHPRNEYVFTVHVFKLPNLRDVPLPYFYTGEDHSLISPLITKGFVIIPHILQLGYTLHVSVINVVIVKTGINTEDVMQWPTSPRIAPGTSMGT